MERRLETERERNTCMLVGSTMDTESIITLLSVSLYKERYKGIDQRLCAGWEGEECIT